MTTPLHNLGDVSFGMYDHFLPSMKAASYTLHTESTLKSGETGETFHREVRDLEFVVDAPRFTLVAQEEIRSCSPPHGGSADYRRILPHIVLDKRALPWERSFDSLSASPNDRALPWMTLILLTTDEMVADGARLQEVRVGDLFNTNGEILIPASKLAPDEEDETVMVLDVSAKLFRAVCPRVEDLRMLAHVRRVRVDEKSGAHIDNERDFAILMSNRLVQPGANVVLLVSLEGWRDWLENEAIHEETSRVRAVILHSWNFVCNTGDGSFATQIRKLDIGLHFDHVTVAATDHPELRNMLAQGYTAIAYQPDGAERTFAWYRGPLSPVDDQRFDANRTPFESADSAIVLEEGTGLLDVSLSSAFQLGRLLALASPSFIRALRHWNDLKQLDALTNNHSENDRMSLVEEMAQYAASHVLGAEHPGEALDDVKIVSEWLMPLRLLHSVPFRYLVPAANLLPPESLRFFYIDENWLDALTDGALSLGTSSSSTQWFMQSNRGALRRTLQTMTADYRKKRNDVVPSTASMNENGPMCGFLLRSSLLDKFPGLEVDCLAAESENMKMEVVRMDMIDSGLLLVIVLGKPTQIRFKLPREALALSHDELGLRPRVAHSMGPDLGTRDPNALPIVIDEFCRTDAFTAGVLDVRRLHDKLEGENDQSGARFALHWLNGPDDASIQWKHVSVGGSS